MFSRASNIHIQGGNFIVTAHENASQVRDWLNAPDSEANFRAALNKRTPGTGQWIFDHPKYKDWEQTRNMLWIQGQGEFLIFNFRILALAKFLMCSWIWKDCSSVSAAKA
ncbi:hypothetical protein BT96DRAFT_211282 [Gymnopus androsaceus JB14]|uniref:Uncharacterized protein n=1 Tax=Gymnopus androsaceus JB14 TaxID=1447944 RepID=A0A6A4H9B5_9AGAR|nr:hypothetical protein BT96DRAFT_211282 [Gymnopus androsaceus JB14]